MEALSIAADGTIVIRFTQKDREALERELGLGGDAAVTLWRYLRTKD